LQRYLTRNGIAIRKFFLNVSRKEQKKRFLEHLEIKEKNWKFSPSDVKERKYWNEYQDAYERMIRHTATEHAPWVIVPADNKWFTRLLVVATMASLKLEYPRLPAAQIAELKEARKQLERE
jgi:polyphosphate kinase 2 (PPK2 family)